MEVKYEYDIVVDQTFCRHLQVYIWKKNKEIQHGQYSLIHKEIIILSQFF